MAGAWIRPSISIIFGYEMSKIALGVYIYRIKKYIGAYATAMGGVDTIVFTGGIGQNHSIIQSKGLPGDAGVHGRGL
jgi:acetate kinase